ncbi:hypothetical protein [Pseudactinotalea sp. Z1748]|uniref:hypothetical protein n=1 Tax=Pseudactinotalea sp. Z1748 TaxID=3413027 RepID=UPI003C7C2199
MAVPDSTDFLEDHIRAAALDLYHSSSLKRHIPASRVLQHAQQIRLGIPDSRSAHTSEIRRVDSVPNLAWVCCIRGTHHSFVIGPQVEAAEGFVFEGAWDGDYGQGQIHRTDYAFGSGARLGRYVVFVPPKHCWEYLYVLTDKRDNRVIVSNSATFALTHAGVRPDSPFVRQVFEVLRPSTNTATAAGFDRYDPVVASDEEYTFSRMMFHNFVVHDGKVQLAPTAPSVQFSDYSHYREFLSGCIQRLAKNASDARRRTTFTPITPLSSGYDSTATAVLASELGYRDAVTQDLTIRGTFDSGQRTGATLGMNVEVRHHLLGTEPLQRMGVRVADGGELDLYGEFLATPGLGDDVMLATMESALQGRMVLNGAMGDALWRRRSVQAPGLPVSVPYGKSVTEFRLRTGWIFVPVPALGARFPRSIQRITRDPEMHAWTLHGPYDRPIPRRIAEEAGVQRGSFATGKAAANPTVEASPGMVMQSVAYVAERYALG